MYLDYFSLERHPFRITPDPALFFPGGEDGRGVILNALIYAITSGEGILKVVGEVGSGKTMLCRMLEEKLPDNVEIVYIANPNLSAGEILYAIAIELKLDVTASTERLKVLHLIQDYLLKKHADGGAVVVFIEEAQSMPVETLEEIRLLSNLETHQNKLMQIVLFGQPELDKILAQKNIRQLKERITHSFRLEPFSTSATGDYLRYRLMAAGCPRKNLFAPRAVKLIARASTGLTRRINILADKALLAAYADSPSRQPPQGSDEALVQPRHVRAAIRDTEYRKRLLLPWLAGGLGLVALGVVGGAMIFGTALQPADNPVAVDTALTADAASATASATGPGEATDRLPVVAAPITGEASASEAPAPGESEESIVADAPPANAPEPAEDNAPATAVTAGTEVGLEAAVEPAGSDTLAMREDTPSSNTQSQAAVDLPEPTANDSQAEDQSGQESLLASAEVADQSPPLEVSADEPQAAMVQQAAGDPGLMAAPVDVLPEGLTALRMPPTAGWLRDLDDKNGYTLQLFSVPSTNPGGLEEYLQFLQLVGLLDQTFICFMPVSSDTSGRWQVMHGEYSGVTPARAAIESMPAYIQQYGPYVRNLTGIQCSYPVEVGY